MLRCLALILSLLLAACSSPDPPPPPDSGLPDAPSQCLATSPRATPIAVYVTPDSGEAPYLGLIEPASSTIRVFAYLMGVGGILDALKRKAGEGLTVRVILDQAKKSTNQKYFDELLAAGVDARWSSPRFTYMHAKVIIADESAATVSSGNYSYKYSISKDRDFIARVEDPDDVAGLIELFDADWEARQPQLDCTRLLVSPINARARLLELIAAAEKTLLVESMQLADDEVRRAVVERKKAGVDVRVLLADPGWITANNDAAAFLAANAISVRHLDSPGVHAKAITSDGEAAYVGSINLSYTSLMKNREVGVVTRDATAVGKISATFESDWAAAQSF